MHAQLQEKKNAGLSRTIQIDKKSLKQIQREIITSYINNYKTIILMGDSIKEYATKIKEFIQLLVALEIVEQDNKKIVAKDFLNLKDISLSQMVKKMDVITRSMFSDLKNMFQEDNYHALYIRDHDINKFRYLVMRISWYGMRNPTEIYSMYNLDPKVLFDYWQISYCIEQAGDCIKRMARYMRDTKLSSAEQKTFVKLIAEIESAYLLAMKSYYNQDQILANKVADGFTQMLRKSDDFFRDNHTANFIGFLVQNTKALISNVNNISKVVYQNIQGETG